MYQNEDVINGNKDLPLQVQIQWKWQTFIQRFESKFVEDLVEQGYQMAIFTTIGQFQRVLARRKSLWPETYFWPIFGQFEKIDSNNIFIWLFGQFVANFRSN